AARVRETPTSTALLLVDPTQVDAVRAIYGAERFDHLAFFPHPAVGEPAPDDASLAEFIERRPIQVLWSGGFQKPDTPWRGVGGPGRRVRRAARAWARRVEGIPPQEALAQVMAARGWALSAPPIRAAREAAALVDLEVRQTRRFEFLKAVAKTGVP